MLGRMSPGRGLGLAEATCLTPRRDDGRQAFARPLVGPPPILSALRAPDWTLMSILNLAHSRKLALLLPLYLDPFWTTSTDEVPWPHGDKFLGGGM